MEPSASIRSISDVLCKHHPMLVVFCCCFVAIVYSCALLPVNMCTSEYIWRACRTWEGVHTGYSYWIELNWQPNINILFSPVLSYFYRFRCLYIHWIVQYYHMKAQTGGSFAKSLSLSRRTFHEFNPTMITFLEDVKLPLKMIPGNFGWAFILILWDVGRRKAYSLSPCACMCIRYVCIACILRKLPLVSVSIYPYGVS